ncbi:MAG: hypothetical protein U9N36_08215 [Euryarchaeota archaeon]|nr:hypothetical protein [Euryarchaeota archaeon]
MQAENAAGTITVAAGLALSLPETQLLDCGVAFVGIMDEWKGRGLGVLEQVMQEDATRSPSDIG